MRWMPVAVSLIAGHAAIAAPSAPARPAAAPPAPPPSSVDPTFLGIAYTPIGPVGGVVVTEVEDDTAAMHAGLRRDDEIIRVDETVITAESFAAIVSSHQPGDTVHLVVLRDGQLLALDAVLSTRQEVLQHRLVGRPVPVTELAAVDDDRTWDLSTLRRPTVVAWISHQCDDCDVLLRRVGAWAAAHRDRGHTSGPLALAVVVGERAERAQLAHSAVGDLPLAVTEPSVFERFVISGTDKNRITFMVIDARGMVVQVSPITAGDDGAEAAVDDVLAACEQSEHHSARR